MERIMEIYRDNGQNSLDEIVKAQNQIGYAFPKNYINLIKDHDAVIFEKNLFDFINIYNKPDERDLNFLSYKDNHLDGNILREQENISDLNNYGVEHLVIFGICANGDYICFDYRDNIESSDPKVVLVYHDDFFDDKSGRSSMVVNNVADSFDGFLNLLHE